MKKILLLGLGLLMTAALNGQVVFVALSPASVEGSYNVSYADTLSSSEWGVPAMTDPANAIQDTLVAFLTDTLACSSATNNVDLAGKIAVVYRGDCEFGFKAKMAQDAGAIACVIINNEPGVIGMLGGTNGPNVTIPVAMISDADGAILMNEMKNGPVEVFFGNKIGYFNNDIRLESGQILRPRYSSIPSMIAKNGTEYDVKLGGKVYNDGLNDQTGVALQAIITLNSTEIYNEISTPGDIPSGDSLTFTLPDFIPTTSWDEGYYELVYKAVYDSTDEHQSDNELESDFVISASDLSYASIDELTMLPSSYAGTRPIDNAGNLIPWYSFCLHFKDANASRLAASAITFSAIKGSNAAVPSLEGEEILLQVFTYDDVFTDVKDNGFSNPIQLFSEFVSQTYTFLSDLSGEIITVDFELDNIVALEDDQRYMFCVTTPNEEVYFGSDPKRDYTANHDFYEQPLFPIEAGAGTFNPNGFGPSTVPGISVSFISSAQVNLKNEKLAIDMNVYPSPASEVLNIDFKQNAVDKVELVNMMGQVVATQNVAKNTEKVTMNIADVDNGIYIVKVHLSNNMTHTMQIVVSH